MRISDWSSDVCSSDLNLRGRIVTAMDVRLRLGLPPRECGNSMSIVAEHEGELYSLMVDSVGEVLALKSSDWERNPPTLDPKFREYSLGIYRLDNKLLEVLDVNRLLYYSRVQPACAVRGTADGARARRGLKEPGVRSASARKRDLQGKSGLVRVK